MKTVLLAPELFAGEGGITRILRLYLRGLCENAGAGDQIGFVSLNDSEVEAADLQTFSTDRLVEWAVARRNKLRFLREAFRIGLSADRIICGHIGQLPVAWAISRLRPRMAYYLVAHGIEVWRPFSRLERWALRGARRILCVSEFTRSQILAQCPMPPECLAVLPNALDPKFNPTQASAPPNGAPIVLSVSRLSIADSYKGLGHLIDAMRGVVDRVPGAKLRIVGRGDALPQLKAQVQRLGLSEAVELPGFLSDAELSEEFDRCRLFALPSQKEGFGLVYLEAMAHGRPCLGARSGGVPEVITPETGLLVDYGDVPGITAALVLALETNWPLPPLIARAQEFSFAAFKSRLARQLPPIEA